MWPRSHCRLQYSRVSRKISSWVMVQAIDAIGIASTNSQTSCRTMGMEQIRCADWLEVWLGTLISLGGSFPAKRFKEGFTGGIQLLLQTPGAIAVAASPGFRTVLV